MSKPRDGDHAVFNEDLRNTVPENTFAGALSFLRRRYSNDLSVADVAVTGIPFDTATTNRPGARFGPRAIREASANMAWERPYGMDFDPRAELSIIDYGDCYFDHGRPELIPGVIEAHAETVVAAGVDLLTFGGDHFITYPLLKAHQAHHGELALIHFDAHTDTWRHEEEDGRVDHGTMFYHAAREGIVAPANSVQIGIRTHNDDEMGFNVLDAPWVHENGVAAVIEKTRDIVGDRKAYLTFDIDCLDPAFAPGTGTPVSGGLSSAQALATLRGLQGMNIIGMDVVEVAPAYDVGQITALAGAHIACEGLGLFAARRRVAA